MKYKRCLSAFVFLIFLFSVSCLGSVLPDLSDLEVITEEEGNSGISTAGLQALSDIISVKVLYRDSEGFA
ncbi:MAG: hypothetical protein LIO44_01005 [Eubacterium sp.]|nr:hypothetical protein [Eubacterium sp.]